jgi:hypothetical protein
MSFPTAGPTPFKRGCASIRAPGIVCRDGAAGYAEAVHQALPDAHQVGDRWHIWHVRREALIDRVEVGDLRRRPVAAGR